MDTRQLDLKVEPFWVIIKDMEGWLKKLIDDISINWNHSFGIRVEHWLMLEGFVCLLEHLIISFKDNQGRLVEDFSYVSYGLLCAFMSAASKTVIARCSPIPLKDEA